MNRGSLGARSLNIALQEVLNPPGPMQVPRFGWTFSPGDKVMQVTNDYERDVFNGDFGIISAVDAEEGALTVNFDGRSVECSFGELDELVLAYATTIRERKNPGLSGREKAVPVRFQSAIQHCGADDNDAMSALRGPPHPLLLGHASVGDLVDAALCPRG